LSGIVVNIGKFDEIDKSFHISLFIAVGTIFHILRFQVRCDEQPTPRRSVLGHELRRSSMKIWLSRIPCATDKSIATVKVIAPGRINRSSHHVVRGFWLEESWS